MAFGPKTILNVGRSVPASADGVPEYKAGGVTIDWSTVPANVADTTLPDGYVVKAGTNYIPFGTVITQITASGLFGPYDTAALDGRQTLARGAAYLVNYTYVQTDPHSDYVPGVFEGGRVFQARIKALAAGAYVPTWNATLAAVFPRLLLV